MAMTSNNSTSANSAIADANNYRETLPIQTACIRVGVSRRTIYNWIAAGKVEYVRTASGSIRIFADSLWREPGYQGPGRGGNRQTKGA